MDTNEVHHHHGHGFAIALSALLLSAGIAGGMFFLAQAFYESHASFNTLSATGSAEKEITADTLVWTATFTTSTSGADISEGTDKMKTQIDAISAYLKKSGVSDENIMVQPVITSNICDQGPDEAGIYPSYSYDKFGNPICSPEQLSYALSQSIVVRSSDVKQLTATAQNAASTLAANDVVFSSQGLEYYYSKLEDLKTELLSEAMKSAQTRAEALAANSNVKLGKLQSLYSNPFNVVPSQKVMNSMDMGMGGGYAGDYYIPPTGDYGTYDTTSINKKVSVSLNASYEVL